MEFNLDQLTQETFNLDFKRDHGDDFYLKSHQQSDQVVVKNDLDDSSYIDQLFDLVGECQDVGAKDFCHKEVPSSAGVLFKRDDVSGSFSLRGLACEDLNLLYKEIVSGRKELLDLFRVGPDELSCIKYFETASKAHAEVVVDQLFNRRFPRDEVGLCNIADPGFSWWFGHSEDTIEIYFKSHGLDRADRFVCLGPMGDVQVAQLRFKEMAQVWSSILNADHYHIDSRSLKIKVKSQNDYFKLLLKLFMDGEFNCRIDDFSQFMHAKTSYFYFNELALLRRFWKNHVE